MSALDDLIITDFPHLFVSEFRHPENITVRLCAETPTIWRRSGLDGRGRLLFVEESPGCIGQSAG